jgi:hypothetical protein
VALVIVFMIMRVAIIGVVTVIVLVMMAVMVMIMIMIMMTMAMIMPVVIVTVMMIMRMAMGIIIGLERRRHLYAGEVVLGHQRLDLGQLLQPDAVGEDLDRHMAIAERQNEARQSREILRAQLDERLAVGHHFGEPAVVEHQQVVGAQTGRLGKIELDTGALAAEHEALLPAAIVEPEQQGVGDLAPGLALGENSLRARHGVEPRRSAARRTLAASLEWHDGWIAGRRRRDIDGLLRCPLGGLVVVRLCALA